MPWLYKQAGSKNWYIGWRIGSTMHRKSTRTEDEETAKVELKKVEDLFAAKTSGILDEAYAALAGKDFKPLTFHAETRSWLMEAEATTSPGTFSKYKSVIENISHRDFLCANEEGPLLADVTTDDLRGYLMARLKTVAAETVNLERKILRMFFKRAMDSGKIKQNPMLTIKRFRQTSIHGEKRRPFTVDEMTKLYAGASEFWQFMILMGFYTGLRMGDNACFEWQAVEWSKKTFHLRDNKTDKSLHIPIAAPLFEWIAKYWEREGRPARGYLFPVEAKRYLVSRGTISNHFYDLMSNALPGVPARPKSHAGTGKGRNVRRASSAISYHCLRHTFISLLKQTGASHAVAKELAGHSSDAMNDRYTHMPPEMLADAVAQLPEFTK